MYEFTEMYCVHGAASYLDTWYVVNIKGGIRKTVGRVTSREAAVAVLRLWSNH